MPKFAYHVRDSQGRSQRGEEDAPSAAAAAGVLRGRGLRVLDLREASGGNLRLSGEFMERWHWSNWWPIGSADVELSLAQLSVMLRGGLTLLTAMQTAAEHTPKGALRRVWRIVSADVQRGKSFAEALARHRCFPELAVQLVRIGEQTGTLEPVLRRAADAIQRRRHIRNSLVSALAYPLVVLIMAIGTAGFMVFNVIPKLEVFLTSLGRSLPPMTQLLLDISTTLRNGAPQFAVLGAIGAVLFAGCYAWAPGRLALDRFVLRIPLIGGLLRLAATALVARSLSILLRSGVTLLEALRTVESLHANRFLRSHLAAARTAVMSGGNLADALRDRRAYLPMLSAMVAIGESAGTLDEVLEETALFQEERLQAAIRALSAIITPVMTLVVGSIVGFVYIAFFVALFAAAGSSG